MRTMTEESQNRIVKIEERILRVQDANLSVREEVVELRGDLREFRSELSGWRHNYVEAKVNALCAWQQDVGPKINALWEWQQDAGPKINDLWECRHGFNNKQMRTLMGMNLIVVIGSMAIMTIVQYFILVNTLS